MQNKSNLLGVNICLASVMTPQQKQILRIYEEWPSTLEVTEKDWLCLEWFFLTGMFL